jgi:hypothetical protein
MDGNLLLGTVMNGIFLAGIGLAVSFINVFWTWGYSRSAAKLLTTASTYQVALLISVSVFVH